MALNLALALTLTLTLTIGAARPRRTAASPSSRRLECERCHTHSRGLGWGWEGLCGAAKAHCCVAVDGSRSSLAARCVSFYQIVCLSVCLLSVCLHWFAGTWVCMFPQEEASSLRRRRRRQRGGGGGGGKEVEEQPPAKLTAAVVPISPNAQPRGANESNRGQRKLTQIRCRRS